MFVLPLVSHKIKELQRYLKSFSQTKVFLYLLSLTVFILRARPKSSTFIDILASSACYKIIIIKKTRWLINARNLFLSVLEDEKSKVTLPSDLEFEKGPGYLWGSLFLEHCCDWDLKCHSLKRSCVKDLIFSWYAVEGCLDCDTTDVINGLVGDVFWLYEVDLLRCAFEDCTTHQTLVFTLCFLAAMR